MDVIMMVLQFFSKTLIWTDTKVSKEIPNLIWSLIAKLQKKEREIERADRATRKVWGLIYMYSNIIDHILSGLTSHTEFGWRYIVWLGRVVIAKKIISKYNVECFWRYNVECSTLWVFDCYIFDVITSKILMLK